MDFLLSKKNKKPVALASFLKKRPKIKRLLQKFPVSLAFLHGSLARDLFKVLSDIDIAILFSCEDYDSAMIGRLRDGLCTILGREDIDLAILNHASPLLCMQVLKKGVLLYRRGTSDLVRYRKCSFDRYLSTNFLRRQFYSYMENAVLGGR